MIHRLLINQFQSIINFNRKAAFSFIQASHKGNLKDSKTMVLALCGVASQILLMVVFQERQLTVDPGSPTVARSKNLLALQL